MTPTLPPASSELIMDCSAFSEVLYLEAGSSWRQVRGNEALIGQDQCPRRKRRRDLRATATHPPLPTQIHPHPSWIGRHRSNTTSQDRAAITQPDCPGPVQPVSPRPPRPPRQGTPRPARRHAHLAPLPGPVAGAGSQARRVLPSNLSSVTCGRPSVRNNGSHDSVAGSASRDVKFSAFERTRTCLRDVHEPRLRLGTQRPHCTGEGQADAHAP